jgi:hypothetical protein
MASEKPLLIFPSFAEVKRDDGNGRGSLPHPPERAEQAKRLGPKFLRLQQAFEAERLTLQVDPQGIIPEFVLVIETRGRIEDFHRAARAIGMDWLGEIDLDDLEPDEDFYVMDQEGQPTDKRLDGRLYLGMVDQRALEELLRLWNLFKNNRPLGTRNTKWRELFSYAKDIRRWDAKDRLLYSGILADWECSLNDEPENPVYFRVELWPRSEPERQQQRELMVRRAIISEGGEVLASARIDEIHFHALKGRIPASVARSALLAQNSDNEAGLSALFRNHAIKAFLPQAQGVASLPGEGEPLAFSGSPANEKPPVVALLDGYPFSEHDTLSERIILHDPDDLLSKYQAQEMRHGTAMASLILHGERDAGERPLSRRIFCRPILEPDLASRNWHGTAKYEHIPENAFAEDRVHRAIVEMFAGDTPSAPSIRIVNLSVGEQPFIREVSPWARLIDWLAWKYKLLFCVSAGNHTGDIKLGIDDISFSKKTNIEKIEALLRHHENTLVVRSLCCPGEAINALTIGAQHFDHCQTAQLSQRVDLLPSSELPSPISRLGPGFRRAIKPEILLPGGRQLYRFKPTSKGRYQLVESEKAPGQRVAAPDSTGSGATDHHIYSRGTSNATALATRAAARLYEVLEELKDLYGSDSINRDTIAPLLKALLVHGAVWPDGAMEVLKTVIPTGRKQKRGIARFLGYGIADPGRVEACTDQRATVIGAGLLQMDKAHEYQFPVPVELSNTTEWRRLVITLAWLTPVNPAHRVYRKAKLSFQPPGKNDYLKLDRQHADWQQVQRGTVQHEILEGRKASVFQDGDNLRIKISAQGDTGQKFDEAIPYGLAVTLEVEEKSGIPVYERIREKLAIRVVVPA